MLIPSLSFAKEPSWKAYSTLLNNYTSLHENDIAWVNYTQIKKDQAFDKVLTELESFSIEQLSTPKEKIAFYINAYNMYAIKMVLEHLTVKSIRDIGSWLHPVWKKKIGIIGNKAVTLDYIEHSVLRNLGEPRIHFAIVCASKSCPNLFKEPYIAQKLEKQLQDATISFLENSYKGINVIHGELYVSKIFSWFKKDFHKYEGVLPFISEYSPLKLGMEISGYLDYNWELNGQ